MKNKKNKIFILGAGASIGSKRFPITSSYRQMRTRMPSAENFFYDLFKINKTEDSPERSLNFLGLTFEGVNWLITQAWNINQNGFDPEEWKGVNVEEVMTFLEVGANMYPKGTEYQKAFKQAQELLTSFMYPFIPTICDGQHCEYLSRVFYQLKKNDYIFTYNWDSIAEFTLAHNKSVQLKNYAKLLRADSIDHEGYQEQGLLLKLHGSFNWMVCENKRCPDYNKIAPPFQKNRYRLLSLHETFECQSCGANNRKPLIVPPVSNKMIHKNSFLKNQWLIAKEALRNASELIFIGYSFPPTDYYSEWLFRQMNFLEEKPSLKITIVNPDYSKKTSLVKKRYDSLFKDHKIIHFKTLKEYAKEIH